MAVTKDWIPRGVAPFKLFADNLCSMATKNAAKWELLATELDNVLALGVVFNKSYSISSLKKKRTALDVQNTLAARKPYQDALRKMGQGRMKYNTNMTNEDRTACGITNDSNGYTLSVVANTSPLVTYIATAALNGKIILQDPKSFRISKPVGQAGTQIKLGFYKKGQPAPKEADCNKIFLTGRCYYNIVFDADMEGMLFVGYARYFNTRGIVATAATRFFGVVG